MPYNPEAKAHFQEIRVGGWEIEFSGFDSLDLAGRGLKRATEVKPAANKTETSTPEEIPTFEIPKAA